MAWKDATTQALSSPGGTTPRTPSAARPMGEPDGIGRAGAPETDREKA